jgi:membrane-associated protein
MIVTPDIASMVSSYGIAALAPIAIVEGPIVTVIAAYLASQSLLVLWQVILCVVIADLVGDGLIYWLGRSALDGLPIRWREKMGITNDRITALVSAYQTKGTSMLVAGKLTHAAGFAVLAAAGAARMNFTKFMFVNLLATIPKSLIFVGIGLLFGSAHAQIAAWISTGSMVAVGIAAIALGSFLLWQKARAT